MKQKVEPVRHVEAPDTADDTKHLFDRDFFRFLDSSDQLQAHQTEHRGKYENDLKRQNAPGKEVQRLRHPGHPGHKAGGSQGVVKEDQPENDRNPDRSLWNRQEGDRLFAQMKAELIAPRSAIDWVTTQAAGHPPAISTPAAPPPKPKTYTVTLGDVERRRQIDKAWAEGWDQ